LRIFERLRRGDDVAFQTKGPPNKPVQAERPSKVSVVAGV